MSQQVPQIIEVRLSPENWPELSIRALAALKQELATQEKILWIRQLTYMKVFAKAGFLFTLVAIGLLVIFQAVTGYYDWVICLIMLQALLVDAYLPWEIYRNCLQVVTDQRVLVVDTLFSGKRLKSCYYHKQISNVVIKAGSLKNSTGTLNFVLNQTDQHKPSLQSSFYFVDNVEAVKGLLEEALTKNAQKIRENNEL